MRPEGVVSKPVSAEVLDTPAQSQLKAENIKITGADGHTETITHGGNCREPSISSKGDVGWTRCSGFDRKGYALNEKLMVRLPDGRTREFAPNSKAPFITGWKFVDNDSGVLIRSMSFHSPQSYIRYDLATGKMTNRKDGTNDAEPMPKWAQPLGD